MKFYLDTEFHEYKRKPFIGRSVDTIDLISIGIVSEEGEEYYAISKEFDIKAAWMKWQQRTGCGDRNTLDPREYWLRWNVLRPIYEELFQRAKTEEYKANQISCSVLPIMKLSKFNYRNFKFLVKRYGKTNDQIAHEIKCFVAGVPTEQVKGTAEAAMEFNKPEFYAYYADYDWVVFCWLYGRMINLPEGFPMYCRDLKQMLDEIVDALQWAYHADILLMPNELDRPATFKEKLNKIKKLDTYPIQDNSHNAAADAEWNKRLHEFIKTL